VTQPLPWELDHSFSKEIFPNIQSKPPLMQLEGISSHPIASYPSPCYLHSQVLLKTNRLHLNLLNFSLLSYHCFVKIILDTRSLVLGAPLEGM